MLEWKKVAVEMSLDGENARTISNAVGVNYERVRSYIKRYRQYHQLQRENHGNYTAKPTKGSDGATLIIPIAEEAEEKPKPEKPKKIEVIENRVPEHVAETWNGEKTIRFGLIGDTHFNNKSVQITYLNEFYDKCTAEGITTVYHAGDVDDGEQMRVGHQYECYTQGADEHVDEIIRNFPRREGITTKFITGNHDASIIKRCGHDIGYEIAGKRDDMIYLGRDCVDVHLTPKCVLRLQHPWDGTAYSLSYKTQKMCDAMEADTKPNILAVGHYHKAEYLFYRNIHIFQTGTFEAQTPFMRGKSLSAHLGGWIITISVDENGTIKEITPKFIPFYRGIVNDYLNYAR